MLSLDRAAGSLLSRQNVAANLMQRIISAASKTLSTAAESIQRLTMSTVNNEA